MDRMTGPFRSAHLAALNKTLEIINIRHHRRRGRTAPDIMGLIDKIFAKRESAPVEHSLVWVEGPNIPTPNRKRKRRRRKKPKIIPVCPRCKGAGSQSYGVICKTCKGSGGPRKNA